MSHYAGLDISMKTTSICIIDDNRKKVFEDTVETDPDAIYRAFQECGFVVKQIALESGSISNWLVVELVKRNLPAICIDAYKMSKVLGVNINKTDKNDARLIAEALRCDFFFEITPKTQENVELGILLGSRRTLIEMAHRLKNTIRGHLKAFGIRLGSASNLKFIEKVNMSIKDKSHVVQMALQGLLSEYKEAFTQLDVLESHIKELAKHDEEVKLLTTVPGVGVIVATSFKVHLGDPKRFKNARAVGAYFGMTPKQYSSGETIKQGRVSKRGSPEMRFLLNEAANVMLYCSKTWSQPKAWGLKILKKKGHKKAIMALGRKLGVIMFKILLDKKPFEFGSPPLEKAKKMINEKKPISACKAKEAI